MDSINDGLGLARRRVSARRWLAGGLALAALTLGLVAVESPAFAATPKWLTVSAGERHTCAIKVNTTLWCWGHNDQGQLGVEGVSRSNVPIEVGGDGWSVVSAGRAYTCGIRNGRRYCWGDNGYGQLGLRDRTNRSTPVAGPGENNNWLTVSAGSTHACGLRTSGLAQCWGLNVVGQLGIDSTVTARERPTTVVGGITWSAIDAGNGLTCGLDVNGRRYCWGANANGGLGLGLASNPMEMRFAPEYLPGDYTYSSIDVQGTSVCGILTSGHLACWGFNLNSSLGLGDTENRRAPTMVPGTGWQSVSVGTRLSCGIRLRLVELVPAVDQRYCWGRNESGQLGDGTWTRRSTPTWVDDGRWRMIAVGGDHACGISSGQYLYCWGRNDSGQLGVSQVVQANEALLVR